METFSAEILLSTTLILTILHLKGNLKFGSNFYFGQLVRSKRIETQVQYRSNVS